MSDSGSDKVLLRPAREADRQAIKDLIQPFVAQQKLLPRTIDELHELLANGFVAECAGQVVGVAALEVYSPKLAEIRSLAVDPSFQGKGVGRGLVEACVGEARRRNVREIMAISSSETFFRACGFDFTLPGEKKAFFLSARHPAIVTSSGQT